MTGIDDFLRSASGGAALAAHLVRQRWFPGRSRTVARLEVTEAIAIAGNARLVVADVAYAGGGSDRFAMPVAVATGAAASRIEETAPAHVIATWPGPTPGVLHDDLSEGIGAALLDGIAQRCRWPASRGAVEGEPTEAFARLRGPAPSLPARRVTAEQSNTSVIFGDRLIVKVIRRLAPGLNPDYEITRHLTRRARFDGIAPLAGALLWRGADTEPIVVAIAQAFVPGATGLRERLVPRVAAFLRALPAQSGVEHGVGLAPGAASPTLSEAEALGRRTGELHLALADAGDDEAFAPAPASRADLARIGAEMTARTAEALEGLGASLAGLPPHVAAAAARVLDARDALLGIVARVATVAPGVARIRVHGDYQLDQVLMAGDRLVIIDFEGEPLRPIAERRAKFLAMKDVAGMVRSFGYAAHGALIDAGGEDESATARLAPLARWWQHAAAAAFVRGHRLTVAGAPYVPRSDEDFDVLLRAFVVEKAAYELRYELGHRPAWLPIPLAGLTAVVEGRG